MPAYKILLETVLSLVTVRETYTAAQEFNGERHILKTSQFVHGLVELEVGGAAALVCFS